MPVRRRLFAPKVHYHGTDADEKTNRLCRVQMMAVEVNARHQRGDLAGETDNGARQGTKL